MGCNRPVDSQNQLPYCAAGSQRLSRKTCTDVIKWHLQVHLQLQEPQSSQMKALRSSLEKARELKLNNQAMEGNAGGVDKSQQQMVMELYQKCATLKVWHNFNCHTLRGGSF